MATATTSDKTKWERFAIATLRYPAVSLVAACFCTFPNKDNVKEILNILGILSGLILTFVVALPGTVGYDELIAADERFGCSSEGVLGNTVDGEDGYAQWWLGGSAFKSPKHRGPSQELAFFVSLTTFCIASSMLCVVVMYTYLSLANIGDPETVPENSDASITATQLDMKAWFRIGRWGILVAFLLLVAGVAEFFVSNFYIYVIKFPDYAVASTGKTQQNGVYGSVLGFQYGIIAILLAVSLLAGWANYAVEMQVVASTKEGEQQAQDEPDATPSTKPAGNGGSSLKGNRPVRVVPMTAEDEQRMLS